MQVQLLRNIQLHYTISQTNRISSNIILQELSDSENLHLVQAPSFCYRFTARRWQSACCSSSVLEGNDVTMGYSEINRPRLNGAAHTDVLYKPCEILTCAKAAKHTADIAQRLGFLSIFWYK